MGPKIGRRRKYWYMHKKHLEKEEVESLETALGMGGRKMSLVVSVPLQLLPSADYIVSIPCSVYLSANATEESVLFSRLNQFQIVDNRVESTGMNPLDGGSLADTTDETNLLRKKLEFLLACGLTPQGARSSCEGGHCCPHCTAVFARQVDLAMHSMTIHRAELVAKRKEELLPPRPNTYKHPVCCGESFGKEGLGTESFGKKGLGTESFGKEGLGTESFGKELLETESFGKEGLGTCLIAINTKHKPVAMRHTAEKPSMSTCVIGKTHPTSSVVTTTISTTHIPNTNDSVSTNSCNTLCQKAAAPHHNPRKHHPCPNCRKVFVCPSDVEKHQVIHTKERPFTCEICGATFSFKQNLNRHERAHARKEKPFKCELCGKSFTRRPHLEYHMNAHSKKRSYHCSYCEKVYKQSHALQSHMRIHTGGMWRCQYAGCDRAFITNQYLKVHSHKCPWRIT